MILTELEYSQQRESALLDTISRLEFDLEQSERRVRWLESLFRAKQHGGRGYSFTSPEWSHLCYHCRFDVDYDESHGENCKLFLPDGTPKPTPEDFK